MLRVSRVYKLQYNETRVSVRSETRDYNDRTTRAKRRLDNGNRASRRSRITTTILADK